MCEEKELLVSYLYDDLADGQRAAFESHLRGCAVCRAELHGLRDVRADLGAWAPPEPDFGFRVVRGGRDAAERDAVRQGLGRIDANVTEEAAMHRELRNYLLTNAKQK